MLVGVLAGLGGAPLLGGCVPIVQPQVFAARRFAAEYNCPVSRVDAQLLTGDNTYVARGCGQRAIYVCTRAELEDDANCRHER